MIDDGAGAVVVVVAGIVVVVVVVVVVVDDDVDVVIGKVVVGAAVVVTLGTVVDTGTVVGEVELVELVPDGTVVAGVGVGVVVVVVSELPDVTIVVGTSVVVVVSATCKASGEAKYSLGHEPAFHTRCRVDGLTQVGSEPLTFRNDARVLPFGHAPDFAYFKVFVLVTQTTAFDLVDQIIFVSPLAQPPDLVVAKMICDLLTQNRLVVDAPRTGPPNREIRSPVKKRRKKAQMMCWSAMARCGGRTMRGAGSMVEPYN